MALEVLTLEPDRPAAGPPVLFVHGSWHGAWCWRERWMPHFAEHGHTVHAVSLRGHGGSPGTYRGAHILDYVADAGSVADGLQVKPILAGHSLGGRIVQHLLAASAYPAAVLVAPIPTGGAFQASMLRRLAASPVDVLRLVLEVLVSRDAGAMVGTPARARYALFSADLRDEEVRRHCERLQGDSLAVHWEVMRPAPLPPRGATPLLLLAAGRDALFPVAAQAASARALGADFEVVPGSGHDIMLDVAWREGARLVLDWLARAGSSRAPGGILPLE